MCMFNSLKSWFMHLSWVSKESLKRRVHHSTHAASLFCLDAEEWLNLSNVYEHWNAESALYLSLYTTQRVGQGPIRVEASITDHLRDSAPNLEKCKVVQNFPM